MSDESAASASAASVESAAPVASVPSAPVASESATSSASALATPGVAAPATPAATAASESATSAESAASSESVPSAPVAPESVASVESVASSASASVASSESVASAPAPTSAAPGLDEPMFSPLALTGALPFLPLAQGTIDYQVDRRADPRTIATALADPRARVMLVKDGLIAVPRGQGVLAKRESAHVRAAMLPAAYLRGELGPDRLDDAFLAFLGVEHDGSDAGARSFGSAPAPLRSGRQGGRAVPLRSGRQERRQEQDDDFGGTPYLALILPDRKYRSRRAAQGDASDAGTDQTGESDDGTSYAPQSAGPAGVAGPAGAASPVDAVSPAQSTAPAQSTNPTAPADAAPAQQDGQSGDYPNVKPMIDRLAERFDWADLRDFAPKASARDAGLATSAVTLSNWQHRQLFCPRCGAPTVPSGSGWTQRCTAFDAGGSGAEGGSGLGGGHLLFPRVEPAVITLVVDAHDRLLIQHNKAWRNPLLYSVSAGFVEAGENLEHAVRRETMEETGVELGELRYLGSQPWPFPGSLMMAFKAQARTTAIHVDGEETADARWVTREELTSLIAMGEVEMPGRAAIARYMIEQWYGMEL